MTTVDRQRLTDQELDLRVRERLLASGAVKHEDIEAYLASLPDVESQAETMGYDQPALGASSNASRPEATASSDDGLE